MIWNPWRANRYLAQTNKLMLDAYDEIDRLRVALEAISDVAGARSSATVRRMSNMAQEALDHGF